MPLQHVNKTVTGAYSVLVGCDLLLLFSCPHLLDGGHSTCPLVSWREEEERREGKKEGTETMRITTTLAIGQQIVSSLIPRLFGEMNSDTRPWDTSVPNNAISQCLHT